MGIPGAAITQGLKLGMRLEWSCSIELVGVVQGQLQVSVTPLIVKRTLLDEGRWFGAIDRLVSPTFEAAVGDMLRELMGRVERAVDAHTLQRRITDKLNSANAFIFPDGGDFRLFKPRFNDHRDLIVDLRWEQG